MEERNYQAAVFEFHNAIYIDKSPEKSTFTNIVTRNQKAKGFLCVLDTANPVLEAITSLDIIQYASEYCNSRILGTGSRYSLEIVEGSTMVKGAKTNILSVQPYSKSERRNKQRIILLNRDSEGYIIESYLTADDEVESRYARETLTKFYNRIRK